MSDREEKDSRAEAMASVGGIYVSSFCQHGAARNLGNRHTSDWPLTLFPLPLPLPLTISLPIAQANIQVSESMRSERDSEALAAKLTKMEKYIRKNALQVNRLKT